MFKNLFIAAAIALANPSFVAAQDIFFSFDSQSLVTSSTRNFDDDSSGSVYIFSDRAFAFDALELDFSASNESIRFTGGEAFNPTFEVIGGRKFDSSELTINEAGDSGRLFSINITQNGVNPNLGPLFDPGFEAGVGDTGAVLLARLDFESSGFATTNLEFTLGFQGALMLPDVQLNPSFGSAVFSTVINACYNGLPGEEPPMFPGDFNQNCTVDFDDVAPFIAVLVSRRYDFFADMDENGVVNFLDIHRFISALGLRS